jgi:hypothetical protein
MVSQTGGMAQGPDRCRSRPHQAGRLTALQCKRICRLCGSAGQYEAAALLQDQMPFHFPEPQGAAPAEDLRRADLAQKVPAGPVTDEEGDTVHRPERQCSPACSRAHVTS